MSRKHISSKVRILLEPHPKLPLIAQLVEHGIVVDIKFLWSLVRIRFNGTFLAPMAQWIRRLTSNQKIEGSIPSRGLFLFSNKKTLL